MFKKEHPLLQSRLEKHWLSILVIVIPAFLLFGRVLVSSGFLPGVDAFDFVASISYLSTGRDIFSLWRHDASFGGSAEFTWRQPLALLNVLVNDANLTVKIFSLGCFLLASFSMYFLVYRLTGSRVASTSSAILFTVNQFFIARWANGHYLQGYAYALTPLLFLTLDSALKSRKLKWIVAFSLSYSSLFLTRYDPLLYITPFLAFYVLLNMLWLLQTTSLKIVFKDFFKVSLRLFIFVVAFSAFFLIPFLFGTSMRGVGLEYKLPIEMVESLDFFQTLLGYSTELSYLSWSGQLGTWWHPFLSMELYHICMLIPVVLAFSALLFRRDRWALFLASSALISVFIAKGLNPPLGEVYHWLYFNFPFFGSVHSPNRLLMITLFCYAVLAGFTIKGLQSRCAHLNYKRLPKTFGYKTAVAMPKAVQIVPIVVIILFFSILPIVGIVSGGLKVWSAPKDLVDAYNWVGSQSGDYRVSTIPYYRNRMFSYWDPKDEQWIMQDLGSQSRYWHNKPVLQQGFPSCSYYPPYFMAYSDSLIQCSRTMSLAEILGSFNVRYLIQQDYFPFEVQRSPDLYVFDSGVDAENNAYFQHEFFAQQKGLEPVYSSGNTTVYQNSYWIPRLYAVSKYLIVVGGREALHLLTENADINLRSYGIFFADQVIKERGKTFFLELLKGSEAIVFVNTEPIDLSMLLLEDTLRIHPAKYAYPSQTSSKKWIATNEFANRGLPTLDELTLTTSGDNDIIIPFDVDSSSNSYYLYDIWVRILYGPNCGSLTILIDGEAIKTLTPTASNYALRWTKVGQLRMNSGRHRLMLRNKKTFSGAFNSVDEIMAVRPWYLASAINETHDLLEDSDTTVSSEMKLQGTQIVTLEEPRVIVEDDQVTFWKISNPKHTNLSVSHHVKPLSSSTGSLKIELSESDRGVYQLLSHKFVPAQDWSDYDFLALLFKGQNTGTEFTLDFYFNSSNDYAIYVIKDNTIYWKTVLLPFSHPVFQNGTIDWTKVQRIGFSCSDKDTTGTFYLGRMVAALKARNAYVLTPTSMAERIESNEESPIVTTYSVITGEENNMTFYSLGQSNGQEAVSLISYKQISSTSYEVEVETSNPFFLMFSEAYHHMWKAYVDSKEIMSIPSYSFLNGFHIENTGKFKIKIEFVGQRFAIYGGFVTVFSLAATLTLFLIKKGRISKNKLIGLKRI